METCVVFPTTTTIIIYSLLRRKTSIRIKRRGEASLLLNLIYRTVERERKKKKEKWFQLLKIHEWTARKNLLVYR